MADFETTVELGLEVARSDLRSARQTIEDGIGGVSVAPDGGIAGRAGVGGGGGGRQGRRMFRWARERTNLLEETVTLLDSIEEKIGEGGGGGLLGGAAGFGIGRSLSIGLTGGITGALGTVSLSALVSKVSITSLVSKASLSTLVNPLTGSIALLIGGVASLGDLVDGDISAWNLPARFGQAIGQGFENAWPDAADSIETFFKNNIFAKLGEFVGEQASGDNEGHSTAELGDPGLSVNERSRLLEQRARSRSNRGLMTIWEAMGTSADGDQNWGAGARQQEQSLTVNTGRVVIEQSGSRIQPQRVEDIAESVAEEKAQEMAEEIERRIARSSATGFGGRTR